MKALPDLEREYRKCVRCGPTVMCKIDRTGNHVHLTFPQRRAWAASLVRVNSFSGIIIHRLIQDMGAYTSVIDFIETLITKFPQRESLREAGEALDSLHYFDINEITSLTADDLGTDKFGNVLRGDTEYLLVQARKEVKRVGKEVRRARR